MKFLLKDQSNDGSWFGRWGVNYVYGTSGVLRALETVSLHHAGILPARGGLAAQRAEGRRQFRRIAASYDVASTKGQGPSTPSQTAWGLIGLLAEQM